MNDDTKHRHPGSPEETPPPFIADLHASLTAREREVLGLIAQGRSNKEIADQLAISVRTVEAHRARIIRKLGLHSHASLIHYAMRVNLAG